MISLSTVSFIYCATGHDCNTCLSHSEALAALPPSFEGWVQLLSNVSDLLGLSAKTTAVSQHVSERHWSTFDQLQINKDNYGMVEKGLGGWFSREKSSVGEGRPSESSRSRWT